MQRLDSYRLAMMAAFPDVPDRQLADALQAIGPAFPEFIDTHGLAAVWHERTGRDEFRDMRRRAEALYLAQQQVLAEIDTIFERAGIDYAVIKGGANRLLLYDNPAVRACHDLDVLVLPESRVRAAEALRDGGFSARLDKSNISRELVMSRNRVDIDLHWALLREGRLREDPTAGMLSRRRRVGGTWALDAEGSLFVLLVHPAFGKHLSSWNMGLHRVVDVFVWLRTQSVDWPKLRGQLEMCGVKTAAWATLRWLQMLAHDHAPDVLDTMLADLSPGGLRRRWLERWLRSDLSVRLADNNWIRLLGFSVFLHDTPGDAVRAMRGRLNARRRQQADARAFGEIVGG